MMRPYTKNTAYTYHHISIPQDEAVLHPHLQDCACQGADPSQQDPPWSRAARHGAPEEEHFMRFCLSILGNAHNPKRTQWFGLLSGKNSNLLLTTSSLLLAVDSKLNPSQASWGCQPSSQFKPIKAILWICVQNFTKQSKHHIKLFKLLITLLFHVQLPDIPPTSSLGRIFK